MALFEYKPVDKAYYEREIRDFLPDRIIDTHTHVFTKEHELPGVVGDNEPGRSQTWPGLVFDTNPIEDLLETYKIMAPGKQIIPVIFAHPSVSYDIPKSNDYISSVVKKYGFPGLYVSKPEETAAELESKIIDGGFMGTKVYLNFAPSYIPGGEIRIFDFLPHHQLEMLNQHGLVVLLHIPRAKRLRDPVNLEQMLEIDRKYPNIKLIIAHVGRAYAEGDLGDALDRMSDTNMLVDFCANTNQYVFEQTIKKIGPSRMLYGTDMPIERMRMKRIVENDIYINVVQRGMYGDVSGDPHMREVDGAEADALSFFMYEEIAAMRRAAENTGLTKSQINDMFFANAAKLYGVK